MEHIRELPNITKGANCFPAIFFNRLFRLIRVILVIRITIMFVIACGLFELMLVILLLPLEVQLSRDERIESLIIINKN
jgi:hypothetical protein